MVSNRMRHFLKMNPDQTTLYFKEHQNSMKDKSTMKNALGYKFEKKKKTAEDEKKVAPWMKLGADERGQTQKYEHKKSFTKQRDFSDK